MTMVTKEWRPSNIHGIDGHPLPEYRPFQVTGIKLDGKDDKNKITAEIQKVHKVTIVPGRRILKNYSFRRARARREP